MRNRIRHRLAFTLALTFALLIGGTLHAGGGSRTGESLSVTGTFAIHTTPDKKQIPLEAVYWLDFRSAKLFATTPEVSKSAAASQMVSDMAIRDLVADFKLERLDAGVTPHFLMNTASLGALGGGTSALCVIETTTKQLAVYWCYAKSTGLNAKPAFELIQVRPYAASTDPSLPIESTSTSGSITVQMTMDKTQVPLDAVYWLESSTQGALLYTAIPEVRKTGSVTQMVGEVASRNIAADFKIKPGASPRFLINTAALGAPGMGMSALFVVETTTKQLGIYRAYPQASIKGAKPTIELMQVKPYDETLPTLPMTN